MTPINRMLIEHHCTKLILLYAKLNDKADWENLAALYTADATFARPSAPNDILKGRAAILAAFKARAPRITQHLINNIIVEVKNERLATAESTIILYKGEQEEGRSIATHTLATPLIGIFKDRLVKEGKEWRFADRRGVLTIKSFTGNGRNL